MIYRNLHNIGLSIIIIGIINLYNIIKEGIIFYLPITKKIEVDNIIGGIKVDVNIIKILMILTFILYIILNYNNKNINITNIKKSYVEYELLIGLSIIGLVFILISNDLITFYLGLECYSFAIIILILIKESFTLRRLSIIYLILSSLSSGFILLSLVYIYRKTGSLNLEMIKIISKILSKNPFQDLQDIKIALYIIIISLLFKLGSGPFIYWIIRIYSDLDKIILWYQLTIPKFIYFIILLKFSLILSSLDYYYFPLFLYFIAIISILIGSIGGLYQNKDNIILSYSSILNIGFVLLTFSLFLIHSNNNENTENLWIIYQYFIIYFFNLLGLFSILYLFSRSSFLDKFSSFFSHPFFFISLLIVILSFIGIPPISGFIIKFHLLISLFSFSSLLSYLSILTFVIGTLLSSFYYLKFLFSSFSLHTTSPEPSFSSPLPFLISYEPILPSYIVSFITFFSLFYYYLIPYFYPFFFFSF